LNALTDLYHALSVPEETLAESPGGNSEPPPLRVAAIRSGNSITIVLAGGAALAAAGPVGWAIGGATAVGGAATWILKRRIDLKKAEKLDREAEAERERARAERERGDAERKRADVYEADVELKRAEAELLSRKPGSPKLARSRSKLVSASSRRPKQTKLQKISSECCASHQTFGVSVSTIRI
jgi:hypothetical protein